MYKCKCIRKHLLFIFKHIGIELTGRAVLGLGAGTGAGAEAADAPESGESGVNGNL